MLVTAAGEWAFNTGDNPDWALPAYDDSAWVRLAAGRSWEEQGWAGYDGFGWYRQIINIPPAFARPVADNGGLVVTYANADDADALYFNGTLVGVTGGLPPEYVSGYGIARRYVVPPDLVKAGEPNLVAIRVYDGGGGGGLITGEITLQPLSEVHDLTLSVAIRDEDWVFEGDGEAAIILQAVNPLDKKVKAGLCLTVTTDAYQPVAELRKPLKVKAGDTTTTLFRLPLPAPGFYRCTAYAVKEDIRGEPVRFNIGYEPEKILSPADAKPDFDRFWSETRAALDAVDPGYRMVLLKEQSGGARDLYQVSMKSFGGVTIGGYYAVPRGQGPFPAIISYMGYGSEPWMPGGDDNPGFAEFVLSVRGQGIQKASNPYGKWILHGLDNKEDYYYRGAFMDLVRAIDFVASRPEVDAGKIAAEGGSQGGAFTLAACALDKRIKAAAPSIPFLSDYRDYFQIAPWPASDFREFLQANPERSWEEIYDLLTYFDIKNLAPLITCPVLMAAGLQDDVCPPHINFAAFNLISGEKQYRVFPDQGHSVPPGWYPLRMQFFREKLGLP